MSSTNLSGLTDSEREFLLSIIQNTGYSLSPPLFGLFLDGFLLALILGMILYWRMKLGRTDGMLLSCFVYYIGIASLAHSGMCLAICMEYYAFRAGDYSPWLFGLGWKGLYLAQIFVVAPVEAFYVHRAYLIWGRNRILLGLLCVPLVTWIVLGGCVLGITPTNWLDAASGTLFHAWGSTLVVIDWSVSGSIVLALLRTDGGFSTSRRFVRKIIMLSAEAQLVPSAIALVYVIYSILIPTNMIGWTFMSMPKMWALPCMIVINFRHVLRKEMEEQRDQRQNTFAHSVYTPAPPSLSTDAARLLSLEKGDTSLSALGTSRGTSIWPPSPVVELSTPTHGSAAALGVHFTVNTPTLTYEATQAPTMTSGPTAKAVLSSGDLPAVQEVTEVVCVEHLSRVETRRASNAHGRGSSGANPEGEAVTSRRESMTIVSFAEMM